MNLQNVGAALRRKLGPLPVWAWAIIGGVALYFIRQQGYLGGRTETADALQPSQADAREPQPQTTLEPGESVYDPNTGALTTAPGGDSNLDDGTQDDNTETLLTAILAAVKAKPKTVKKPKQHKPKHKPKPKDKRHHKPPKRKPKPKHKQRPGGSHGTGGQKRHNDPKPRTGSLRWKIRPLPKQKKDKHRQYMPANARTPQGASANGARQRPTVPLVTRGSHTQHPVSTHGKVNRKPTQSPPRPSSPPRRAHRAGHGKPRRKGH